MPNERLKLERRLLGKLNRLGSNALNDAAVWQSVQQLALELMETVVARLVARTGPGAVLNPSTLSPLIDDLTALIPLAQEQGHSGLEVMAVRLLHHLQWMLGHSEFEPVDAELPARAAQDLLRMLHELAVGVIKPPNPDLISVLRGFDGL